MRYELDPLAAAGISKVSTPGYQPYFAGGPGKPSLLDSVNGKHGAVQITAGSNVTVDNTGKNEIVISSSGGGGGSVSDGDKGDITVSASGATWTVDNGAITDAKVASGITATKIGNGDVDNTELSYVNGVTSAIQTQLGLKAPLASPTFTGTVTVPVGLTGVLRADTGIVSTDSDVTDIVAAASATAAGKIEIATDAETTTGTDTTRAITPANLTSQLGSRVQAYDADLATIAGLTATTDNMIMSVASAWASRTPLQVRTALGLIIGTNVQAYDADLDTWAGITPAAGVGTFLATPTSANLKTAVTDETGSGALVFANSPALVTPTGIVKGDVGLGNVDNTSNATERAATATLTNKRVTARVTAITSSATPTINTDNCDAVDITALATAITSMTTNLTGTPVNKDKLLFEIKDDGTARAITWGASFVAGGIALPTTTVLSKILTVGFIYSTANGLNKWRCIASAQEA